MTPTQCVPWPLNGKRQLLAAQSGCTMVPHHTWSAAASHSLGIRHIRVQLALSVWHLTAKRLVVGGPAQPWGRGGRRLRRGGLATALHQPKPAHSVPVPALADAVDKILVSRVDARVDHAYSNLKGLRDVGCSEGRGWQGYGGSARPLGLRCWPWPWHWPTLSCQPCPWAHLRAPGRGVPGSGHLHLRKVPLAAGVPASGVEPGAAVSLEHTAASALPQCV